METEFIYWSHRLPRNIEVAEIWGGEDKSAPLWKAMALQLLAEHSDDGWRVVGHFPGGAPFFEDENRRVSLTHSGGFMAVAWMPEADRPLGDAFDIASSLGIDAEKKDRRQVLKIRPRFLSEQELQLASEDDTEANILLWTIKEAVYKAALTPGLDFREQIRIEVRPGLQSKQRGKASAFIGGKWIPFVLFSWESEGFILTVATAE